MQAIQFKFGTASNQARRKDTAANQFAAAENDISSAQAARDEDPTIFNSDDLRQMDAQIQQANLETEAGEAMHYDRISS